MSRNSGGTYSLPAGNPVASGTPITIAWANGTLDDIATALTDSLSRSGQGGMTAPLQLPAGLVGAPALTFTAETTLGLYRSAAGSLSVAVGGSKIAEFNSTGLGITGGLSVSGTFSPTGVILAGDGLVGAPAYSFTADPDTGVYRVGGNSLGIATGGVLRLTLGSTGLISTVEFRAPVGSAAAPTFNFTGDTDTGLSAAVADTLVLGTAGVARGTFSAAQITLAATNIGLTGVVAVTGAATFSSTVGITGNLAINTNKFTVTAASGNTAVAGTLDVTGVSSFADDLRGAAGDATTPTYSFTTDTDTGMYRAAANTIGFAAAGAAAFAVSSTAITAFQPIVALNAATVATPDITFTGDLNTGFYSPSADEISFSLGGTGYLIGYRGIPQNIQNGNYGLVLTDSGKHVFKASGGSGETYTIPANVTIPYPIGTAITLVNMGGGTLSVVITSDVLELAGGGVITTATLADNAVATILKVAAAQWIISGTGVTGA